jgi:hypothetical protein
LSDHERPAHCRNCGTPAPGAYCPACGQETQLHPPSAREFLHEFAGHYIAVEGALWRTLKALLVPGKLTLEYFAGRRRQYVLPLRLYLTASLLFFVVVKVLAPQAHFHVIKLGDASQAAASAASIASGCGAPCRQVQELLRARYGDMPQEQLDATLRDRLVSMAPYAMFFLVPLFALLTRAVYWRRPRNYGEHLVFAFHVHTFAFLTSTIAALAGWVFIETFAVAIYLAFAMQRVFGGRMWVLVPRFLFIFTAYFLIVALAVVAVSILALFL